MSTKKAIIDSFGAIFILIFSQTSAELIASIFAASACPMAVCNAIAGILYVFFAILLLEFYAKKILKEDLESFCIKPFCVNVKWGIVAILLPAMVIGIFLLLPGNFVRSEMTDSQIGETLCAGIFFTGIAAGVVEELVFRGFVMNLLQRRWNKWVGILIPSVVFGIVHILGMEMDVLSCVLVMIAGTMVGIMFSLIELEGKSVWNNAVIHVFWNIIVIGGGLTISEKAEEYSIMTYVLESKNFAVTGGEFGIESSIIAVLAYMMISIFAVACMRKNRR